MRVNRGVIPLAKVRPPSCSKPTEMHFQLSYVKLWVYSRQDTDVFTLSLSNTNQFAMNNTLFLTRCIYFLYSTLDIQVLQHVPI